MTKAIVLSVSVPIWNENHSTCEETIQHGSVPGPSLLRMLSLSAFEMKESFSEPIS